MTRLEAFQIYVAVWTGLLLVGTALAFVIKVLERK